MKHKLGKSIAAIFALLLLVPVVSLAWIDHHWFGPRLSAARAHELAPQEVPPRLLQLLHASHGDDLNYSVVKVIAMQPGPEPKSLSEGQWLEVSFMSSILVAWHCSAAEQERLYLGNAYTGPQGPGLQHAALTRYGRKLNQLDDRELATLVASLWMARGWYERHPEALQRRTDLLLERVATGRGPDAPW